MAIPYCLSFSALIFASKFHLLHRENADWWRLRVHGLTILMIWAVLPPASPGIWIATGGCGNCCARIYFTTIDESKPIIESGNKRTHG